MGPYMAVLRAGTVRRRGGVQLQRRPSQSRRQGRPVQVHSINTRAESACGVRNQRLKL